MKQNNRINPPSLFNLLSQFRLLLFIVWDYWLLTLSGRMIGHPKMPTLTPSVSGILSCTSKFHWLSEACVIATRLFFLLNGSQFRNWNRYVWLSANWSTGHGDFQVACTRTPSLRVQLNSIISSGDIRKTATQRLSVSSSIAKETVLFLLVIAWDTPSDDGTRGFNCRFQSSR